MPSIKWQYFISKDGIYNEFPAYNFPSLLYPDCKNIHDNNHRYYICVCVCICVFCVQEGTGAWRVQRSRLNIWPQRKIWTLNLGNTSTALKIKRCCLCMCVCVCVCELVCVCVWERERERVKDRETDGGRQTDLNIMPSDWFFVEWSQKFSLQDKQ